MVEHIHRDSYFGQRKHDFVPGRRAEGYFEVDE